MKPMHEPRQRWHIVLFVAVGLVLVFAMSQMGRHRRLSGSETTTTGAELEPDPNAPLAAAASTACTSHISCSDSELCTRGRCEPITNRTTECRNVMIRFARGSAELSTTAAMTIERAARCINAGRSPTIAFEESRDALSARQRNDDLTQARRKTVHYALEKRGVPRSYLDEIHTRR